MAQVYKLTQEQADELQGQEFAPDSFFKPIKDNEGNWIIGIEEVNCTTNDGLLWVKELPLIDYVPKPTPSALLKH